MFSDKLKELRNNAHISQSTLAKALFVSQQAVAKWEIGTASPNPEMIKKIAEYFDVSIDYLLGRAEQQKEPATNTDDELDDNIKSFIEQIRTMSKEDLELLNSIMDYVRSKRDK